GVAGTLTFANGDFINSGSIRWNQATNATAALVLSEAGGIFSNAAGGQIILESGGTGTFQIKADEVVNAGTNFLNAGTLQYVTRTGAGTTLRNSGTILFAGGFLNVTTLTNSSSGVLKGTASLFTNISGNTIFNFGTIDTGSGVQINLGT